MRQNSSGQRIHDSVPEAMPSTPSAPTPEPCLAFSASGTAYRLASSPSILGDSRPPTAREAAELLGVAVAILSYCRVIQMSSDSVERAGVQTAQVLVGMAFGLAHLTASMLGSDGSESDNSANQHST